MTQKMTITLTERQHKELLVALACLRYSLERDMADKELSEGVRLNAARLLGKAEMLEDIITEQAEGGQ